MPPQESPRPTSARASDLGARLEALGQRLAEREAEHGEALGRARACAERLRATVAEALLRFHAAAARGAPGLRIELSEVRVDEKHLRAFQFELQRGRHRAIVTVKSRGEVTLVGPFRAGKQEGPCLSFPLESASELDVALGDFLEKLVDEAATP